MCRPSSSWHACLLLLVPLVLAASCATPPDKEIALARAALDSAASADADRLAPDDYVAAQQAMTQAVEAVADRDYRLALSRALDARERADAATARAAEQRSLVRAEVERMLAAIDTARTRTQTHLRAAAAGRAAGGTLAAARATVAAVDELVQEARSALERGDSVSARERLQGVLDRLRAVDADLQAGRSTETPSAGRLG